MTVAARFDPRIPPELRTPPGRPVKLRGGLGGMLVASLFVLVFIGMLFFAIAEPIFLISTPTVPGRVVSLYERHGKGTAYVVRYQYSVGASRYSDEQSIPQELYDKLQLASPIRIHVAALGSWRLSEMDVSWHAYAVMRWVLWMIAAIWSVIITTLIRKNWTGPRWLVRHGEPVVGRIVSKTAPSNETIKSFRVISDRQKTPEYFVSYEYQPSFGPPLNSKMPVSRKQFDAIEPGSQVVVLYDPVKPQRTIIYDLCDFQAV
jgi:uncharacterized protein DUF3592